MSETRSVNDTKGAQEKPCIAINAGSGCLAYATAKQVDDFRAGLAGEEGKADKGITARGGMIVLDEKGCALHAAKFLVNALLTEPCGRCVPCREGIRRMRELLVNIADGKGEEGDVALLEATARGFIDGALCTRVLAAPKAVLEMIVRFRDEFEAHVREKRCPAGVCKELITFVVDPEKCTGCTVCARNCPTGAAAGERKQAHKIDRAICVRCGLCRDNCKFDAISAR